MISDHLQRAHLLISQERYDWAERELRLELAEHPDDPLPHALLSICLAEGGHLAEAVREARSAVAHGPHLAFSHYVLSRALLAQNQAEAAERAITEALRLDPDDADYFALRASIHLQQRRWEAALAAAEAGVAADPAHTACANLRAMALVKLGRAGEAGQTIQATLALDPENALTHANQGWTLLHAGEHRQALEHFQAALRIDPANEWARSGMIEALKARHLVYRWMLRYFLWISRLSGQAQWVLIIGAWVGSRLLGSLAEREPELASVVRPLLYLYFAFVFLTWAADPLFNLLLRLNRFGRALLTRRQVAASNWVGGLLLTSLVCLLAALPTGYELLWMACIGTGLMVIPVAGAFGSRSKRGRTVLATYAVGLAVLGLAALGAFWANNFAATATLSEFFLYGFFIYGWVANFVSLRR